MRRWSPFSPRAINFRAWTRAVTAALAALVVVAGATPASAQDIVERLEVPGNTLAVRHFVGEVKIEAATGRSFEIVAHIRGDDAEEGLVELQRSDGDDGPIVSVMLPLDQTSRYVYPELDRRSNVRFRLDRRRRSDSVVDHVFRRFRSRQVTVSGGGRGLELWTDVTIRVPANGELILRSGVGRIDAADLTGQLSIDSNYGSVLVEGIKGSLVVDVGNGPVEVTGSEGDVEIDSGNGEVVISGATGERVELDSGNGRILVEDVDCSALEVDTGNGPVEIYGLSVDRGVVDTGNGRVEVEIERLGDGRFEVDTGNGSVSLRLPPDASAEVIADTSRGGVHLDVADDDKVEVLRKKRDALKARFGAGDARIVVDSGNGSIEIVQ